MKDFKNTGSATPENGFDETESNISGSFESLPFPSLLKLIHQTQRTGVLYLENPAQRTMIFFEKGNIVGVSSSNPVEQLSNFMVSQGLITDRERVMAAEIAGNTNMPLGRILVTGGKIKESEMQRLLRTKAEQVISSILLFWDQGEFSFHHGISVGRLFVRIQIDPMMFLPKEEGKVRIQDPAPVVEREENQSDPGTQSQVVTIVPVDNHNQTILFCEMNIVEVDSQFRRVEDLKGLTWELQPGEYNVKVFLPTLFLKTIPLTVFEGQNAYRIVVQERTLHPVVSEKHSFDLLSEISTKSGPIRLDRKIETAKFEPPKTEPPKTEARKTENRYNQIRKEKRFDVSIPISLRTPDGNWISTSCINLSTTGLCVIICEDPPNSDLYVRLFVPTYTAPLECPGSVCWVKHGRVPKIGVKLYLSDQMKSSLDSWLIHHDRSKS